jgi:predicted Holliday junction resolvase-like endonuclease
MLNLNTILLVSGIIILAIAAVMVTNKIGSYQKESALARQAEAFNEQIENQSKIADKRLKEAAEQRKQNVTLKRQLENERAKDNSDDDCRLGAEWVRIFDSYANVEPAASKPNTTLQRFAPPTRRR